MRRNGCAAVAYGQKIKTLGAARTREGTHPLDPAVAFADAAEYMYKTSKNAAHGRHFYN
ncbi:MAG: hypothetical protein FWC71_01795 [Defluviitaleaceae bacterium]|nr:hypothetical protein [Defluviitaleaceae bacterium]